MLSASAAFPRSPPRAPPRSSPPGDPAALADELRRLLADPAARAELAAGARAAAAGRYAWDAIAAAHLELDADDGRRQHLAAYRDLLGEHAVAKAFGLR